MADLVIKNGKVITPQGVIYGGVATEDGRIVSVGANSQLPHSKRVIDAQENFVIPGLIDAHVHYGAGVDLPLEEAMEVQFPLMTRGAVHGGVTTIGQFVTTPVGTSLVAAWDITTKAGNRQSYIDYFLHACVVDQNHVAEEEELHRRGTTSFKHFFNPYKPPDGSGKFRPCDEGTLFRSFELIAKRGYPALGMVHCEEMDIIFVLQERLQKADRKDLAALTESRPNFVEAMRISHALNIAKAAKCPLYIVHISTAEGAEIVAQARREGFPIYTETFPHYLTHTAEMEKEIGCWGKINPPLRYPKDIDAMWHYMRTGDIGHFGTDCSAGSIATKENGGGKHNNIWNSRNGICGGSEHMLPVLMTFGVHAGRISMEDLVRICCYNNARVFGLYPRKGVLSPGSDADITIIDPNKEAVISPKFYHTMGDYTIYDGWKIKGMARTTIVRGQVMMEEYETVGKPGWGHYLPCLPY